MGPAIVRRRVSLGKYTLEVLGNALRGDPGPAT